MPPETSGMASVERMDCHCIFELQCDRGSRPGCRLATGGTVTKGGLVCPPRAGTFVQWKSTDLCMDLHCACGQHTHIDATFAYHVRCSVCGAIYRMPVDLGPLLTRVSPGDLAPDDLVADDNSMFGQAQAIGHDQ